MINVQRFRQGDNLSRELIDTMAQAISELQEAVQGLAPRNDMPDMFQIQNDSGDDLDAFSVLGISGSYFDPTDTDEARSFQNAEPVLVGDTPAEPDHVGKFAILLEPLADGQVGMACVAGVCQVKVDGTGDYADIKDGETSYLKAGSSGLARVLWRAAGAGEQWAVVRLGGGDSAMSAPANVKTIHAATFDAEALATVEQTAWEYDKWLANNESSYPFYFDGSHVRYDGYKDWEVVRVVYSASGGKTLWAYYREVTYLPDGRVWKRGEVTREAIDVAEDCSE